MKGSRGRSQHNKKDEVKRSPSAAGGRGRFCCSRLGSVSPNGAEESEDWECYCCRRSWRWPSWKHKDNIHVDDDKSVPTRISTLAHFMVQHRLDQMIRETTEHQHRCRMTEVTAAARRKSDRRASSSDAAAPTPTTSAVPRGVRRRMTATVVDDTATMVVVEKCSEDPRRDFVDSVATMITANKLQDPKDLRALLEQYMSINPQQLHAIILDAFHQVCTDIFLSAKYCCHSADF